MTPPTRIATAALAAFAGVAITLAAWPDLRAAIGDGLSAAQRIVRSSDARTATEREPHDAHDGHEHGSEGLIKLSDEQIARAKIDFVAVGSGAIARRLTVPGTVTPDADRIGRVAAKVVGTVAELRKRLGDRVAKGEVIAVLESREVADAKSEFLAALVRFELQKTLFEREQTLWERKISAEQQYLRARSAFSEAELRLNVARQKLSALDLSDEEVAALPAQAVSVLRHKEIRAPLDGQVIERKVHLGAPVGGEGQENELFVIADLRSVWINLSVPVAELASIKPGLPVAVKAAGNGAQGSATIVFVSPVLDADTRSARVIAAMDNESMRWRPGSFVTATIVVDEQVADLVVPRPALQSVGGEQVVFVRTGEGIEKREVVLGRTDDDKAEIVFGLDPGEVIAATNTFVLKAELGKSEADHGHAH